MAGYSKVKVWIIVLVLISAISGFAYFITRHSETYEIILKVGETKVYAEVADSDEELSRGLMGRGNMSKNHGMWFIFPDEAQHAFWMKDTLLPLDLIFVSANMEVVDIKKSFEPCLSGPCRAFIPKKKAQYVLEVNAGFSEKNQIAEGTAINIIEYEGVEEANPSTDALSEEAPKETPDPAQEEEIEEPKLKLSHELILN